MVYPPIALTATPSNAALIEISFAERVRKLEDKGIIEGYTININREKIGLPITAFFKLRVQR